MTRRSHNRWGGRRIDELAFPGSSVQPHQAGSFSSPWPASSSTTARNRHRSRVRSPMSAIASGRGFVDSAVDVLEVIAGAGGNPT